MCRRLQKRVVRVWIRWVAVRRVRRGGRKGLGSERRERWWIAGMDGIGNGPAILLGKGKCVVVKREEKKAIARICLMFLECWKGAIVGYTGR